MRWLYEAEFIWPYVAVALTLLMAFSASIHAILNKRDSRAAVLWVGFIWLAPVFGPMLYVLFGINRIQRQAAILWREQQPVRGDVVPAPDAVTPLRTHLARDGEHLGDLVSLANSVTSRPIVAGNRIQCLVNGDAAFPAMIEAIDRARHSVCLASYIFDRDAAGRMFVDALAGAVKRGVEVRVLLDDAGARYSIPGVVPLLRRRGVRTARFLPTLDPWQLMGINLRNHRKILVTDGQTGFTGGMNIRAGNLLQQRPRQPVQDVHFRVEGPVVSHLQESFAADWRFTTGELLAGPAWFPGLAPAGSVFARGISDGPDGLIRKLRWIMAGALNAARRQVRIVTPYFLPDEALISALSQAARRGVRVEVLLPRKSNLPFVHWATFAGLWQLLMHGVEVWLTPPPFDHSKLMTVDGQWALIGSTNWDPRSLRLNFEFNVECYDAGFVADLDRLTGIKREGAELLTLEKVDARRLPIRLRDGVARLLTPFL